MAGGSSQPPTDMLLLSSDSVMFYTNEEILLNASNNSFRHLLPFGSKELSQRVLVTDLSSSELEIVLRAIFDVPNSDVRPLIDVDVKTLTRAIDSLPEYGISPTACITPESNLYQLLLACAPLHPLEVYAQAAHHGLDSLATIVSSHTLVVNLAQLTDELSVKMGPVHALRLFQLHIGRVETLKRLLSHDIGLHDPTRYCDFDGQKVLKEKWNIGIAFMSTKIEPGEFLQFWDCFPTPTPPRLLRWAFLQTP